MTRSKRQPSHPPKNWRLTLKSASRDPLNISLLALPLMWTALIAASLWWNLDQLHTTVQDLALTAARASFQKDILFRQWASNHGGVYVPVTDQTPPNPYLTNIPERDITTPSGRQLTLMNPAYMTRQLYELGQQSDQSSGHITSLNPIRPANAPDDWERQALEAFEHGTTEVSAISDLGGEKYMRLMRPLITAASCLKCHAAQGYKEGEIRGGISVAVRMQQYAAIVSPYQRNAVLLHGSLWGVGLGLILAGSGQLRRRRRERAQVEAVLRDSQVRMQRAESVAHFGNWAFNLNDRSVDVSPGARLIYGLQGEAWSVADVQNIPLPEYRPALDAALSNLIEHNQPYDLEFRIRRPSDGQLRDIHSIAEYDPERRIVLGVIHDITARKQIETALQISLTKYQTLFEALPLGVTVADRAGQITESNQAASQILGLSPETQPQRQINDQARPLVRPDGTPMPPEEFAGARALKEQRQVTNVEMGLVRDDGRTTWISATAAPLALAEQGVIVAYMDITERKRAEEALRQSEARWQTIINTSPDGICLTTLDGVIQYASDKLLALHGYQQMTELLGRNVFELLDADYHEQASSRIDKMLKGVYSGIMEYKVIKHNGSTFFADINAEVLRDAAGQPVGLLLIERDVTARKQAEDALRESEEKFRAMADLLPQIVFESDVQGRLTYVNQQALRILGYPADYEITGFNTLSLYIPEDRARAIDNIKRRMQGQPEENHEYTMRRYDGSLINVLVYSNPIVKDNRPAGLRGIIVDITDRKRAEAALHELNATLEQRVTERTAELQAANRRLMDLDRLKDEFLSRTSHELLTPLTSIKIYIELLETSKPEKHAKYLQTLKQEAARLHALIEEVLTFSHLNLDIDLAGLGVIDLSNLIEGRLTTWRRLCDEHGLHLQLDMATATPHVRADGELIMQALSRLMTNAVNYTPAGSVTVSTACVDEDDRRWLTISVKDTGPGITPADLPHIFERFYRGRAAADYKTPGVGVGLSISREIVEKLGGRLTVETQVGAGSTFTVWLPVGSTGIQPNR